MYFYFIPDLTFNSEEEMEQFFSNSSLRLSDVLGAIVFDNMNDEIMPTTVKYRIRFLSEHFVEVMKLIRPTRQIL